MHCFELSWVIGRVGRRAGGTLANPGWNDIKRKLDDADSKTGSIGLSIVDVIDIGPDTLEVRCDSGNYLLNLLENTEGGSEVREYTNNNPIYDYSLILGDIWDPKLVCSDFAVVKRAFREFYQTGDVSHDLLS